MNIYDAYWSAITNFKHMFRMYVCKVNNDRKIAIPKLTGSDIHQALTPAANFPGDLQLDKSKCFLMSLAFAVS